MADQLDRCPTCGGKLVEYERVGSEVRVECERGHALSVAPDATLVTSVRGVAIRIAPYSDTP